ncbi:MAG: hypothetical protein SFU98_16225 [Leptospiraceae bacterium]|nr:hypothetical protein [Leptospiraceae bacterium]
MFFGKRRNSFDRDSLKERMRYLENFLETQLDIEKTDNELSRSLKDEIKRIRKSLTED